MGARTSPGIPYEPDDIAPAKDLTLPCDTSQEMAVERRETPRVAQVDEPAHVRVDAGGDDDAVGGRDDFPARIGRDVYSPVKLAVSRERGASCPELGTHPPPDGPDGRRAGEDGLLLFEEFDQVPETLFPDGGLQDQSIQVTVQALGPHRADAVLRDRTPDAQRRKRPAEWRFEPDPCLLVYLLRQPADFSVKVLQLGQNPLVLPDFFAEGCDPVFLGLGEFTQAEHFRPVPPDLNVVEGDSGEKSKDHDGAHRKGPEKAARGGDPFHGGLSARNDQKGVGVLLHGSFSQTELIRFISGERDRPKRA